MTSEQVYRPLDTIDRVPIVGLLRAIIDTSSIDKGLLPWDARPVHPIEAQRNTAYQIVCVSALPLLVAAAYAASQTF